MLTPKETAMMLDAEGSICIVLSNLKSQVTAVVALEMAEPNYPKMFHEQFGGYLYLNQKSKRNPKHSDMWSWTVKGKAVRDVLTYALPELQLKRVQAEALLLFADTIGRAGGRQGVSNASERVSLKEQVLRWTLYEVVKKLNKKGPPISVVEEIVKEF